MTELLYITEICTPKRREILPRLTFYRDSVVLNKAAVDALDRAEEVYAAFDSADRRLFLTRCDSKSDAIRPDDADVMLLHLGVLSDGRKCVRNPKIFRNKSMELLSIRMPNVTRIMLVGRREMRGDTPTLCFSLDDCVLFADSGCT